MNCLSRLTVALLAAAFGTTSVPAAAADDKPVPSLAAALEDFVQLLEKDDRNAAGRWARDAEAAKLLEQRWAQLKQCHKDYNYRTWLDGNPAGTGPGARQIGDATKFTVGGHSYGHLHLDWEKGSGGWRVTDLRLCR